MRKNVWHFKDSFRRPTNFLGTAPFGKGAIATSKLPTKGSCPTLGPRGGTYTYVSTPARVMVGRLLKD